MRRVSRKIRKFFVEDHGPTAVEYAVMLSLVVLVCIGAVMTVGTQTNKLFTKANSSISSATSGGSGGGGPGPNAVGS